MLCVDLLRENRRVSGRRFTEHRAIETKHWPNLLEVSSPGSLVIVSYNLYGQRPYGDRPEEGIVRLAVRNRNQDILQNFLQQIFMKSSCIDRESMVLASAGMVTALDIDIHIIETNGNTHALCVLGIVAVLNTLKIKTLFQPRLFSYASVDGNILSDPDEAECLAAEWNSIVVMKSTREILFSEKTGGACLVPMMLETMDRAYRDVSIL